MHDEYLALEIFFTSLLVLSVLAIGAISGLVVYRLYKPKR
ncbi:hypothetical protein GCM10027079_33080 [Sediminivirga luteola]|jgi:hypothetical protein|uniref:Uncharacterized protein n=1 Tax=Sediminivirga luteola TaxID=1774748 RepID=A0A8J2TY06_9MICO|nr:hypothetical protein GCM10011333_16000 [Sediminivirga luteola]